MNEPPASGPLAGYTVLDISQMIAGPVACVLLSDMGAEVIKVEPIDGESTRHINEVVPRESPGFTLMNRGKRDIPVDLACPEGREIVRRLAARADVAVVGYRPDACAALGIDYESLASVNPRLVYVQNTAFGTRGPMAHLGGYDIVVQGLSGLLAINGAVDEAGQPKQIVPAIADFTTAVVIAWAVTAALLVRERTGQGQRIETSLLASGLLTLLGRFRYFEAMDAEPVQRFLESLARARAEDRSWPELLSLRQEARPFLAANIYYRTYATADSQLVVGCLNNPTRVAFLRVTGLDDPRIQDGRLNFDCALPDGGAALVAEAERVLRGRTTAEWLEVFGPAKIPAGPLRFPEELLHDEQVAANDYLVDLTHPLLGPYRTIAPVARMSDTPLAPRDTAPLFGEHTLDILRALGYTDAEASALVDKGIVVARA